nr:hypothetical protein [Micromonospora sp. DSM 115978]
EELRRVLVPHGALGLLVFVQTCETLPDAPEGNAFPRLGELAGLLAATGFRQLQEVDAASLPSAPATWRTRTDQVESALAARHHQEPAWKQAKEQEDRIGQLVKRGDVCARLVQAVAI